MAYKRDNGWAAIVRYGGVGDNLIAVSPAMALKKKGYKVEVITADPAWCVFEHNPWIDKLSVKSNLENQMKDMLAWQTWHRGRADEYDIFAHLSHSIEYQFAFLPSNTPFYYPAHVRRKLANHSYLELAHDICGVPYDFGPLFFASDEETEKARETKAKIGQRVIGWAISGTRIDKIYPYSPMAIARLIKELDAPVVMIGGGEKNFKSAEAIMEHVGRQNGSTDGLHLAMHKEDWPLRRSLSFALQCDLMIGPDTGTMWAVAFEQMPKLMMLSHASPENITKHWINTTTLHADQQRVPCWPCHQLHDSPTTCTPNKENNGAACISDISVERLVEVASTLWNRPAQQLMLAAE